MRFWMHQAYNKSTMPYFLYQGAQTYRCCKSRHECHKPRARKLFSLRDVQYCPEAPHSYFSVRAADANGCNICFDNGKVTITAPGGAPTITGSLVGQLYLIPDSEIRRAYKHANPTSQSECIYMQDIHPPNKALEFHWRLGHMPIKTMQALYNKGQPLPWRENSRQSF